VDGDKIVVVSAGDIDLPVLSQGKNAVILSAAADPDELRGRGRPGQRKEGGQRGSQYKYEKKNEIALSKNLPVLHEKLRSDEKNLILTDPDLEMLPAGHGHAYETA
jgi:hypothetical protein